MPNINALGQEVLVMLSLYVYVKYGTPGMMLHTKYQGFRPCGLRQENCFMFSLYKPM